MRPSVILLVSTLACGGLDPAAPASPADPTPPPGPPAEAPDAGVATAPDAGAGEPDAGPADAGAAPVDAGVIPAADAGRVPAFLAVGSVGRTMLSCDDGHTWVANRSDDDTVRCGTFSTPAVDCGHGAGAAGGAAVGNGWLVVNFGWGSPGGQIRRSRDGVTWQTVHSSTAFWANMVFGAGRWLAGATRSKVSDDALTFVDAPSTGIGGHVRRAGFGLGTFVLIAQDAAPPVWTVSRDGARSFTPLVPSPPCGGSMRHEGGILEHGGALIVVDGNGNACRSTDGLTWARSQLGGPVESQLVSYGGTLYAWGWVGRAADKVRFSSTDGVSWAVTATMRAGGGPFPELGPAAVSPNGTFVAASGSSRDAYGRQELLRSSDGVTWQALGPGAFTQSHPLTSMHAVTVERSAACP